MMNVSVKKYIKDSRWNEEDLDFFRFDVNTPNHKMIEAIFINVPRDFQLSWKRVYKARPAFFKRFACRILCYVLIYKLLRKHKRLPNDMIEELIGKENFQLINHYYDSFY
jgi:hypothetical protein